MDAAEAREFLKDNHRAVLTTFRKDGGIQMSPITVGVDSEGYAIISSREPAYKVRNLKRDGRASVCVFTDGFYGPWVMIEGEARIVSLPDAMEGLVDYYRGISGKHPDWDEYRSAMNDQKRCLIRISIERTGPNVSG